MRAQYTKSFAIIAIGFFGFSSEFGADRAVATTGPQFYADTAVATSAGLPIQSDNPYEVPGKNEWKQNLIDLLLRLRFLFDGQSTTAVHLMQSGTVTIDQLLAEIDAFQQDYALHGLRSDLTPAEEAEGAADALIGLELLDTDPGVLTVEQRASLAETFNDILNDLGS